jgi:hypothetical protein
MNAEPIPESSWYLYKNNYEDERKNWKDSLNFYSKSILKEYNPEMHRYHGLPKCFLANILVQLPLPEIESILSNRPTAA